MHSIRVWFHVREISRNYALRTFWWTLRSEDRLTRVPIRWETSVRLRSRGTECPEEWKAFPILPALWCKDMGLSIRWDRVSRSRIITLTRRCKLRSNAPTRLSRTVPGKTVSSEEHSLVFYRGYLYLKEILFDRGVTGFWKLNLCFILVDFTLTI